MIDFSLHSSKSHDFASRAIRLKIGTLLGVKLTAVSPIKVSNPVNSSNDKSKLSGDNSSVKKVNVGPGRELPVIRKFELD